MCKRTLSRYLGLIALVSAGALLAAGAGATSRSRARFYQFFYTARVAKDAGDVADVWRASFVWSGGKLRLTSPLPIAAVPHASGILRLRDGRLLVGTPGRRLFTVDAQTGTVGHLRALPAAEHVVLDQAGQFVPSAGKQASSTSADVDGVFDRYTGDLILVRGSQLTAVDPRTLAPVSELTLPRDFCEQASTDNRGHLLVTCGNAVVFVGLASARRLNAVGTIVSVSQLTPSINTIASTFVSTRSNSRRKCRTLCHRSRPAFGTHPLFTG